MMTTSTAAGDKQLHPRQDHPRRLAAGGDPTRHRTERPQRVEPSDDRAPDAPLQLDGLGVHCHVGQSVEGAEHQQRREHEDGGRSNPQQRKPQRHRR